MKQLQAKPETQKQILQFRNKNQRQKIIEKSNPPMPKLVPFGGGFDGISQHQIFVEAQKPLKNSENLKFTQMPDYSQSKHSLKKEIKKIECEYQKQVQSSINKKLNDSELQQEFGISVGDDILDQDFDE